MSDILYNLDSNGTAEDSRDYPMASPAQSSPLPGLSMSSTSAGNAATAAGLAASTTNGIIGGNSTQTRSNADSQTILSKPRLMELVREIDPAAHLDEDVEESLLQISDDFVDDVIKSACNLAKHRKSQKVEVRDVQLHLERKWNMWIPGFGTDELRPYKRAAVTEAHKQRLALIRKTIKKY